MGGQYQQPNHAGACAAGFRFKGTGCNSFSLPGTRMHAAWRREADKATAEVEYAGLKPVTMLRCFPFPVLPWRALQRFYHAGYKNVDKLGTEDEARH